MRGGLLLLTGGPGSRMGAPKQALTHPSGVSWGQHLVAVFQSVFPEGPVLVLGEPLRDRPDLMVLDDPRQGPAVALRHWAATPVPEADRWWVVACDQVRWRSQDLQAWACLAWSQDPEGSRWVVARAEGRLQPLGGWLPHGLRPLLGRSQATSLGRLVASLPHLLLDSDLAGWRDVDTPQDRVLFERGPV